MKKKITGPTISCYLHAMAIAVGLQLFLGTRTQIVFSLSDTV